MPSKDKRKLAAIMFIDVVGYSRMMASNEERTLELLKDFEDICSPIISDNEGEIIKKIGDELFCEFSSAKQAVDSALAIQKAIQPYNDSRPKDFKLQVRIGIHVGDIVLRDGDVFGDGVNVASRIQPFANPGGICVSNAVRDAISSHPNYNIISEGQQELKNIIDKHSLYRVETGFEDFDQGKQDVPKNILFSNKVIFFSLFIISSIALLMFYNYLNLNKKNIRTYEAIENSLAILNIENITNPDDSERWGQILQELIISDLSNISSLKVFSRQRLFEVKKQILISNKEFVDQDLQSQITKLVGAKTALFGSIIVIDNKIILTTKLVNVNDGIIIRSQKVEGNDLFLIADAISDKISIDLNLEEPSKANIAVSVKEKTSSSLSAYQYYLEGIDYLNSYQFYQSINSFENAIDLDSTFSMAYYKLAIATYWINTHPHDNSRSRDIVVKIIDNDIVINDKEYSMIEAAIALFDNNYDDAIEKYNNIVQISPDEKEAWYGLGEAALNKHEVDLQLSLLAFLNVLKLDPQFRLVTSHIHDILIMNKINRIDGIDETLAMFPMSPFYFVNEYINNIADTLIEFNEFDYIEKYVARKDVSNIDKSIFFGHLAIAHSTRSSPTDLRYERSKIYFKKSLQHYYDPIIFTNFAETMFSAKRQFDEIETNLLDIITHLEKDKSKANIYAYIGQKCYEIGNYKQALIYLNLAKDIFFTNQQLYLFEVMIYYISLTEQNMGNYNASLQFLKKNLSLMQDNGIDVNFGYIYFGLGKVYQLLGNYELSLESYNRSLQLMKKYGDYFSELIINQAIGEVYYQIGDLNQSLYYFDSSREELKNNYLYTGTYLKHLALIMAIEMDFNELQNANKLVEEIYSLDGALEWMGINYHDVHLINYNLYEYYINTNNYEKARFCINLAYKEIMERAELLSTSNERDIYLNNKLNKAIVEGWEKVK